MPFFKKDKFFIGCLIKNPFLPNSLLFSFKLPKQPTIFDIGGYKGEWSKVIENKYPESIIYIFEPIQKFADDIRKLFSNNKNINVYNFGLSGESRKMFISLENESSSVYKITENRQEIILKDIFEFTQQEKLKKIDLIKINIEGEEYSLIESMIQNDMMQYCDYILVQFHDFIPDAHHRRNSIIGEILQTHENVFSYPFVWELYKQKKI